MPRGRTLWKTLGWLAGMFGLLLLVGCKFDPVVYLEPEVWIDSPADGSQIMEGTRVSVSSVVRVRWGTLRAFSLTVKRPDGSTFQTPLEVLEPGEGIVRGTYEWVPSMRGDYTLVAFAQVDDEAVESSPVRFRVVGIQAHRGLPITPSPSLVPSATPAPSVTPSRTPVPSATSPLAPSATSPPPSPSPTATQDTEPPVVDQVQASETEIKWPECEPAAVTFTARATDPSGISGVHLLYRVVRSDGQEGIWQNKRMTLQDAAQHIYAATVEASELSQSLDPPVTASTKAYLEYFVVATDNPPGQPVNTGQAPPGGQGYQLPLVFCTVVR